MRNTNYRFPFLRDKKFRSTIELTKKVINIFCVVYFASFNSLKRFQSFPVGNLISIFLFKSRFYIKRWAFILYCSGNHEANRFGNGNAKIIKYLVGCISDFRGNFSPYMHSFRHTATPRYHNPKTVFRDSFSKAISSDESPPIFFPNRLLSAAQSWSHTATDVFPADGRGTTMGGRGFAVVDNGTTTTVPLALFRALTVRITAGRHFWISMPSGGSKLTHQTSPRRIGTPPGFSLTANTVSNQAFTPFAHFRIQRGVPFHLQRKLV